MGNSKNSNIVVGLDIGTSKVVCIVGTSDENDQLEIISLILKKVFYSEI